MQNMSLTKDNEDIDDQILQCLTFMLGGKVYGLDILNIKEIIEYDEITEVPMTPDFISGVINLRGNVVPVIDLALRFSNTVTEITKRTSIVVTEIRNDDMRIEIGITVDIVNEVLNINPADIEPAPALGTQIQTKFISGMAKINGKLLILLDIEKILTIEELSMVGDIHSGTTSF